MKVRSILFLILASILSSCWPVNKVYKKPPTIDLFYDRVVLDYALKNPELLSYARIIESYGIHYHNSLLTDASDEFNAKVIRQFREDLDILRSYDQKRFSTRQQISTTILDWYLQNKVEQEQFMLYSFPLNQLEGTQNELPNFMVTIHTINNKRDAVHYIKRLRQFKKKLRQVKSAMQLRQQLGIVPPDFILKKVIRDMEAFSGKSVKENILYVNFANKIDELALKERDKKHLLKDVAVAIEKDVYPIYKELIGFSKELLKEADERAGVWKYPGGDAYYRYMLKNHTTTSLTPEEVHAIGLREVDRIEKEIREVLNSLGYDENISISTHLRNLSKDPEFLYPNTDEGRAALLQDYEMIIKEAEAYFPQIMALSPDQQIRVERIPRFKERTSAGAYYEPPSYDGSRPGIFYVNLRDMQLIPKYSMRSLAYHEAIPGHHSQIIIQLSTEKLPLFRRVIPFTAFVEGWALYAERLAWEKGLLDDPYDNLGRLEAELFRAVRLVVDSGLHYKRWSREQAIAYMRENTGMDEKNMISEVERYVVDPGQASAYKVGELKILELRQKAQEELGKKFDLDDFHKAVLVNGGMPLEILEKVIENYIRDKKAEGKPPIVEQKG